MLLFSHCISLQHTAQCNTMKLSDDLVSAFPICSLVFWEPWVYPILTMLAAATCWWALMPALSFWPLPCCTFLEISISAEDFFPTLNSWPKSPASPSLFHFLKNFHSCQSWNSQMILLHICTGWSPEHTSVCFLSGYVCPEGWSFLFQGDYEDKKKRKRKKMKRKRKKEEKEGRERERGKKRERRGGREQEKEKGKGKGKGKEAGSEPFICLLLTSTF